MELKEKQKPANLQRIAISLAFELLRWLRFIVYSINRSP